MGDSASRGSSKQRTYKEAHMERLGSNQGLKREKSRGGERKASILKTRELGGKREKKHKRRTRREGGKVWM